MLVYTKSILTKLYTYDIINLHFYLRRLIMNKKIFIQALTKFIFGFLIIALLLFIPAGGLDYRNGWLFIFLLFLPMLIVGIIMMFKQPELLKKRLNAKENETEQKSVIALSGIMFTAAFVAAGLNHRFQWLILPDTVVYISAAVFLLGYLMYAEVLRENVYLSRTVEVQEEQTVIDSGLYGIVRHPMYCSTLILFLSMGLVLGSVFSFIILLSYIPIIAKRIKNEEEVLSHGLKGYEGYKKKVRYKVIPFIW